MTAADAFPIRRLGDGYEPHVDEDATGLTYSLPVDSGFFSTSFSFRIAPADLAVLLADGYRRAVLEVVAHTVLQRSLGRGRPKVTEAEFAGLVASVLHSSPAVLAGFLAGIDREHHITTGFFIEQAMSRRPPPVPPGCAPR